jgi:acylphosphatase
MVTGRVQGVGFRAFVAREAKLRRVEGWVRNCADGRVEAVFAGPAAVVEELIAACRVGPISSRVTDLVETDASVADLDARPAGISFAVLA